MRIDRQRGKQQRETPAALDRAQLAEVKGGLKAERVQGADPSGSGGD
jgi:hypothetical protein